MLGLMLLAATPGAIDAIAKRDFACAQATARAVKVTSAGPFNELNREAHAYYLGRLSGRDHFVRWKEPRWEERIDEALKRNPIAEDHSRADLKKCLDYYIDELPDLASD